ncbi:hypothetical protein NQ314_019419 [Rhamnusium bicolor]|uniref:Protein msta n=1 Tax=Rhamnusium bicolor TaxID=1586634 RepID=A0AAV8WNI3_9CUCU|nr:hypothetical protein NQ314_019419 [Rhamnusium bicolor]
MTKGNYKILKNSTFGRYMVAGKSIKAGELILSEKPTLLGPQLDGPMICFNCCRHLRNVKYIFCEKCKTAVICGPKCTGYLHNPEECSALKDTNINEVLVENDQIIFPLRCLYLEAALMAHDCVGNAHLSVDDDFVLTIHASVDISENSLIFFNYANVLQLGTDLSSLKCHKCRKGLIRSKEIENVKSDWECSACKHLFRCCLINSTTREGQRRIEEVDPTNITELENLLKKMLQTFHPNNYLILELQQNMLGLYVRLPHNKKNLTRKITLCQRMLEVFAKLEPGLSRIKAITLHELQSALVDLAHKQYRDKEINAEELIVKLLTAETPLKEAIKHLLYEPSKSPEGRLAQTALSELKVLRMSINDIQRDLLSIGSEPKNNRKLSNKMKNNEIKSGVSNKMKNNEIKSGVSSVTNVQKDIEIQNNVNNLVSTVKKSSRRKRNKNKK